MEVDDQTHGGHGGFSDTAGDGMITLVLLTVCPSVSCFVSGAVAAMAMIPTAWNHSSTISSA